MRSLPPFLSRISIRLLAFNVLLVFLPAFGILSLETYEQQLLTLQERSMVQQGRILAAALGERGPLDAMEAERILINLRQRLEGRLRVVDRDYYLLADTSRLGPQIPAGEPVPTSEAETRRNWMYRFGSVLYRLYERLFLPPEPPLRESEFYATAEKLDGEEIRDALAGRYGGAIRVSPTSRSLTLYSAIPVRSEEEVVGVVLVSRSTFLILRDLYDLRLSTFKVILASVGAAIVLSLLVSTTIARPISRLRKESMAILDRRGRLKGRFRAFKRRDEIGDLSRALQELTRRLEGHIRFIESFASDVSHEFKNPLASIRNATDLLAEVEEPEERERFHQMILGNIAHLEQLLSGVREITQIDAHSDELPIEPVRLDRLLRAVVEQFELRNGQTVRYCLTLPDGSVTVAAAPERLAQVFENLLDNATSFSPAEGQVAIELTVRDSGAVVRVRDQGPGIPEEHLDRIFARFFTYRPGDQGDDGHTGLGLSIVQAIVESSGGSVRGGNAEGGGAVFEVELPLAS